MLSSLSSLQHASDKGMVQVVAATSTSKPPATKSLPLMSSVLPGFDYSFWSAMYMPGKTLAATVTRVNALLQQALKASEMAKRIEAQGMDPLTSGRDEVNGGVKRDKEKSGAVIRNAKITLD